MSLPWVKAVTVCALSTLFVGCAGSPTYNPPDYRDHQSKAFNVAKAGRMMTGIKDTKAPENHNNTDLGEVAYNSADLYFTYFMNPSLGLTNWGSLGFGVLGLFERKDGNYHTLLAWMPKNDPSITYEKARENFDQIVNNAVLKAFEKHELNAEYVGQGKFEQHIFNITNDELLCNATMPCSLEYRIDLPAWSGSSPGYISEPSEDAIVFSAGNTKGDYSWIEINSEYSSKLKQQEIYQTISENLPGWAYLYLPANKIRLGNTKKITFPVLLNEGKPELFIYPKGS